MWIYDVEVLDARILDPEVKILLAGAQKDAIVADVTRRQELLRLDDGAAQGAGPSLDLRRSSRRR